MRLSIILLTTPLIFASFGEAGLIAPGAEIISVAPFGTDPAWAAGCTRFGALSPIDHNGDLIAPPRLSPSGNERLHASADYLSAVAAAFAARRSSVREAVEFILRAGGAAGAVVGCSCPTGAQRRPDGEVGPFVCHLPAVADAVAAAGFASPIRFGPYLIGWQVGGVGR